MNGVQKAFRIGTALWRSSLAVMTVVGVVACGEASPPAESAVGKIASELSALPAETPVTQALAASAQAGGDAMSAQSAGSVGRAGAPVCDAVCNAKSWIGEQRYAEAREALERHLVQRPADVDAAIMLTATDIADEEYASAYERASAFLDEQHDVRLAEKKALAGLLADDVATAAIDYKDLISDLRDEPEGSSVCDPISGACQTPVEREGLAWVGLATAEYNGRNLDEAEKIATQILGKGRLEGTIDVAYGQFISALVSSQRGDHDAALENYQAILARFPNEPGTLNNVGGIYYRRGDLATARRYHMASYEASGDNHRSAAIAWSNVGELDMLEGKFEAAEDKLLEATAISKGFAGAYFNLAVLYDLLGRHDESLRNMRLALSLDEQGVTRWNTTWLTPEWEQEVAALIALAEGRTADAQVLFDGLKNASEPKLAKAAAAHLADLHRTASAR
jgi:tetratricopeptide (TPR) repeat protein